MAQRSNEQARRFHQPLEPQDTDTKTVGCRHTNPDICSKHSMSSVCAFARGDGMCLAPPKSWPKQFKKLVQLRGDDEAAP